MKKKIQQYKIDGVAALSNELKDTTDVFFTEYRGLTVLQITQLRRLLRAEKGVLKITKNSRVKIAFTEAKKGEIPDNCFRGPTAIAFAKGESGPVAKVLVNFAKENNLLVVKGGLVDGSFYDDKKVVAYGNLPTKLEMLATLASTVNGVASKLVRTLQAVIDQKAGQTPS